jgi:glycosyltransferase involved in cell wall biosynthesis
MPWLVIKEESSVSNRRLRVLSVAHSAHGRGSSRLRYRPLSKDDSIELLLAVPERWKESGRVTHAAPPDSTIDIRAYPIQLPWVRGAKWYLHWYPGLSKMMREFEPDVIHLWEEPWAAVSLQAVLLRNRMMPRAALILETEQNILRKLPPPFERIRRFTLRQTDWLVSRNREAVDVSRACGYSGGSTIVEYCFDASQFRPQRETDVEAPETLPLRLGYVGRIIREKGLFTVLDALLLSKSNVKLEMLGDGADRASLMNKVHDLGLEDRVTILPSGSADEVARFMASIDVLVLMSETTRTWKEQFGRVIIEAQACGAPVIGSTSGNIPFVVSDGGWIVEEGNATKLAHLIDQLADNRDLVRDARQRARRNVQRFTESVVAASLLDAWRQASDHRQSVCQAAPCLAGSSA